MPGGRGTPLQATWEVLGAAGGRKIPRGAGGQVPNSSYPRSLRTRTQPGSARQSRHRDPPPPQLRLCPGAVTVPQGPQAGTHSAPVVDNKDLTLQDAGKLGERRSGRFPESLLFLPLPSLTEEPGERTRERSRAAGQRHISGVCWGCREEVGECMSIGHSASKVGRHGFKDSQERQLPRGGLLHKARSPHPLALTSILAAVCMWGLQSWKRSPHLVRLAHTPGMWTA